jgi:hypothetical protein
VLHILCLWSVLYQLFFYLNIKYVMHTLKKKIGILYPFKDLYESSTMQGYIVKYVHTTIQACDSRVTCPLLSRLLVCCSSYTNRLCGSHLPIALANVRI